MHAHTVSGRPTLKKDTERFRNGLVRELKEKQTKLSRHSMTSNTVLIDEMSNRNIRNVRLKWIRSAEFEERNVYQVWESKDLYSWQSVWQQWFGYLQCGKQEAARVHINVLRWRTRRLSTIETKRESRSFCNYCNSRSFSSYAINFV